ncbi:hypothetical protein CN918_27430 [Priestia megaterium]|nr:hypothetical protein CN918_27430 [Priestia megaterium]
MIVKNWGETPEKDTEVKVEVNGKVHVVELCVNKKGLVDIYLVEDKDRKKKKCVTVASSRHDLSPVDVLIRIEEGDSTDYSVLNAKDIVSESATRVVGDDGIGFWCSISQGVLRQYVEEKHEPRLEVHEYEVELEINIDSFDDGVEDDDDFISEYVYVYSPKANMAAELAGWEEKKGHYFHKTKGHSTHIIDATEENRVKEEESVNE